MKQTIVAYTVLVFICTASIAHISPFTVTFEQSMRQTDRFTANLLQESTWKKAACLYTEHLLTHAQYHTEPRIPTIIHHIWLGSPMPPELQQLRATWIKQHPQWRHILWTDQDIAQMRLINQKLYAASRNYGERSDIARLEILYRYGGLYVDTDFECLKSFDDLHHYCDFYAGLNCGPMFMVFNGLIASKPGHPILKECIDRLQLRDTVSEQGFGIEGRTGPGFFTEVIRSYIPTCTDPVVLMPTSYFYPWPFFERGNKQRAQIERWIKPETMAIHHWHTSWLKKR